MINGILVIAASLNQIEFRIEYPLPVKDKGIHLDCGYRLDLSVEDEIILELKSVEQLKGIHEAQLLTSMKPANIKQGFLILLCQIIKKRS